MIIYVVAAALVALLFTDPTALGDILATIGRGLTAIASALSDVFQSATGGSL